MKFTEAQLEQAFITLLTEQGYPYVPGEEIARASEEIIFKENVQAFLLNQYRENFDGRPN